MEILKINEIGVHSENDPSQLIFLARNDHSWMVWSEAKNECHAPKVSHHPVVAFSSEREAAAHFESMTDALSEF